MKTALGCLSALFIFAGLCAVSWWIVYWLLYALCWCFNMAFFGARIVTGIWILMLLIGGLFK